MYLKTTPTLHISSVRVASIKKLIYLVMRLPVGPHSGSRLPDLQMRISTYLKIGYLFVYLVHQVLVAQSGPALHRMGSSAVAQTL